MPIKRIWHGWTTLENADAYERVVRGQVFDSINAKNIEGYQGIELFRRKLEDEIEFMTVMTFDSLQNVIDFQGENYANAYVPDAAQAVLKRWDKTACHFEAIDKRDYT